ncbi:hypothetical protein VTL71DRAFT_3824 [Oculimacula yallundae]|uniref:Rhodopsin domain-containing protein n=1 Tax=Oculimacula yallundae TaxID=86028 RepID=A0ABR4C5B5_9HELO
MVGSTSPNVGATASPPPPGVIPNLENPDDILHTVAIVTSGLALALTTLVTAGRFYVRLYITQAVFIEDWFCIASWFCTTAFCITMLLSALVGGGGYHAWDTTPEGMVRFQKIQYSLSIIYGPCVWCIKVALLLILVRVFTPFKRIIWAVWAFIFAMLVYNIIATMLKMFICTPFSAVWDTTVPGKCLDSYTLFSVDTSLSILTDLIILILPIPLVWSLQVSTRKKVRTIALLGAGGVATSCGIVRLILIVRLNDSFYSLGDQTVTILRINLLVYVYISLYRLQTGEHAQISLLPSLSLFEPPSHHQPKNKTKNLPPLRTAELAIGIICACLPAFNIFFAAEKLRRSQRSRTHSHSRSLTNSKSKSKSKPHMHTRTHPAYPSKASLKLSNLPTMTPFSSAKLKGTPDSPFGERRVGELRDSYVEIGTPQDIGALLISLKTPDGATRKNWPLRNSRQESYFELRPGMGGEGEG